MRAFRFATLCLLLAAARGAAAQTTHPGGKATAPVDLEMVPQVAGQRPQVSVSARPRLDAASLTVEVSTEDGLALADSVDGWKGEAVAGEALVQKLDLVVTGPGEQRLVVSATLHFADGSSETAIQVFTLNPAPPRSAFAPGMEAADVITGPGGRRVVEVMTGP